MTPRLVFAVTPHREIRVMRQEGEHIEQPAGRRLRHLGSISPLELAPGRLVSTRLKGGRDEGSAWREIG